MMLRITPGHCDGKEGSRPERAGRELHRSPAKDGYGSDDTRQRYCGKCQGGNRDRHNGGREKKAMGGSGKESAWSPDLKKKWSGHGSVCL